MLERIYAHTHSDKGPYGTCSTSQKGVLRVPRAYNDCDTNG
jgi:aromatic ring-opening dioxygenase LigB subunit